jgi:hypothetical protein
MPRILAFGLIADDDDDGGVPGERDKKKFQNRKNIFLEREREREKYREKLEKFGG